MVNTVPIVNVPVDWNQVPEMQVDQPLWGSAPGPKTTVKMALLDGDSGILIYMQCWERDPLATHTERDSPVWEDSCMECFLNFAPQKVSAYICMEANANGTLYCTYGTNRTDRTPLAKLKCTQPTVEVERFDDHWSCLFHVPMEITRTIFGRLWFLPGDVIAGNFYKCCENEKSPHCMAWNPVTTAEHDLHQPSCFGQLELVWQAGPNA